MSTQQYRFPLGQGCSVEQEFEALLRRAAGFPPRAAESGQPKGISVEQLPIRIGKLKADLIRRHTQWLSENDTAQLYQHVTQAWRIARILDFTREIRGRFLELGCFDGFIAEKVRQQGGKEVIGVDRLEKALERAAARGIETRLADLDDAALNFPDHHFDCVFAGEVLDYLYDPDAVIEETCRVLKPGGKLIVTVPNLAGLGNRMLLLFGSPPYSLEVRPSQGGYWRYFTFDTIHELLRDHGFRIELIESTCVACPLIYLQFLGLPLVNKLFPSKPFWKRHRLFFSRTLARMIPRLGEHIVVLAERPA